MKKADLSFFLILIFAGLTSCKDDTGKNTQASSPPVHTDLSAKVDTIRIFAFSRTSAEAEKNVTMPWGVRLEDLLAESPTPLKIEKLFYPLIPETMEMNVFRPLPQIVILDFGLNEAWVASDNPQSTSQLPLPEFRQRLWNLSKSLKDRGIQVILITPNPVQIPAAEWRNDRINTYADAVREIANEFSSPLVDLQSSFGLYASTKGNLWSDLLIEGKYPNDIGHAMIAEDVAATLSYVLSSH